VTRESRRRLVICCLLGGQLAARALAQEPAPAHGSALQLQLPPSVAQAQTPAAAAPAAEPPLTLQQVLTLARTNSQQLRSALLTAQLATEDRVQARAALLPGVNGLLQHIYTEPNGTPSGVFISNDGPHVYNAWANAHGDLFSPQRWGEYRAAAAAEAVARARADVAARGLVATIVEDFYTLAASAHRLASAQQSLTEAQQFLDITQRQEAAGEVAHADVVKAQIQVEQRMRDAQDAELNALKARLGLSVLIFPDFREILTVVDDLETIAPLQPLDTFKALAIGSSPDLEAAQASVQQESSGVFTARSELLPSVSFDYWYGINANQFATFNSEGERLLGSSAQVQMTIPMWNWGATQSKLRQAQLRVQQAKADLTLAQRQLQANVVTFYREAEMARQQVDSLKASLDLATESLRLTVLRYQAGESTVLEVVDAQSTLLQARTAYDDGLVRYRVALAALQTLTGTL
jgi:outer membrane protein